MNSEVDKEIKNKMKAFDNEKNYNKQKFPKKLKNFAKRCGTKIKYITKLLYYYLP